MNSEVDNSTQRRAPINLMDADAGQLASLAEASQEVGIRPLVAADRSEPASVRNISAAPPALIAATTAAVQAPQPLITAKARAARSNAMSIDTPAPPKAPPQTIFYAEQRLRVRDAVIALCHSKMNDKGRMFSLVHGGVSNVCDLNFGESWALDRLLNKVTDYNPWCGGTRLVDLTQIDKRVHELRIPLTNQPLSFLSRAKIQAALVVLEIFSEMAAKKIPKNVIDGHIRQMGLSIFA